MFFKKSAPKDSKSDIKNIVTLNTYTNSSYMFKNDAFQPLNKLIYNTSNFITSYVSNKDMITSTIQVSRSIPQEDVEDVIEIKAYEELGLDQASQYIISSIETESNGEEREFHLFVVQPEILDQYYLPVKQETKYIDLIIPAPLLYKTLYTKEILDNNGVHAFMYFTNTNAFITFYKNGEYLYSKSISFSLEEIYEKYCEIIGEQVDKETFFSVLETEGLKATNDTYQQGFMKIFGEVFITINDIIIYTKRAFELDSIDQMFIGSSQGPVIGLDEYSQNYLGLPSADLNFNYNIHTEEWYTDQLQYLMLLNSLEYMEDESFTVNLTMYPRPPSFFNRASGQFISATVLTTIVGLSYPLYLLLGSYVNEATIFALTRQNNDLTKEVTKYKRILGEKKNQIAKLDEEIKKLSDVYKGKTETLSSIYDKKVNYRLKSGIFHTIAEELHKFDVKVDKIYSNNDTYWLSLVSTNDRKFTELIKYISDTHFHELKQIDIERIEKGENDDTYKGLLKVDLK